MSLILTRSPYFVDRDNYDADTSLILEIGDYAASIFTIQETVTLNFNESQFLDISPFLNDYLGGQYNYTVGSGYSKDNDYELRYVRVTISGNISGTPSTTVTEHYFTDGYSYSTEAFDVNFTTNLNLNGYYAGSSDKIYKYKDAPLRFPLLNTRESLISGTPTSENVTIQFFNGASLVNSQSVTFAHTESYNDYKFITELSSEIDRFTITNINGTKEILVETIDECKYTPYRCTFKNKYGVYEDLWFFKRSNKNMSRMGEKFRDNSLGRYLLSSGTTNPAVKSYIDYNVNGKERLTLNSGFVDETLNESFKQMLLSEDVTLLDYDNSLGYAVNVASSEFSFKTHVNDKLINYEISFELSHEIINNVG